VGGEIDTSNVTVTVGGQTVAGSFTLSEDAQNTIKALTAGASANVTATFVPTAGGIYSNSVEVTLPVTAKAAGSTTPSTPETPSTPAEGENEAVVDSEVTVVLKSATLKGDGKKAVKPTVYVYTAEGKKLSSKLFSVSYDNNDNTTIGDHTLTVTLLTNAYTFAETGESTAQAAYTIVNKTSGLVLTTSTKAVAYGETPVINVTVKQGSKKIAATPEYNFEDLLDENGNIPAGIYSVAVTAKTAAGDVSTQVLVTVKATKVTLKSIKLDTYTQAQVKELDKEELENLISSKIVTASKGALTADEISVNITNINEVVSATKTVKVKYTVTLNEGSNKTFTAGKFVTEKSASVSLKVKG
jgi:hypothetical protein